MTDSKAWSWDIADKSLWQKPSIEYYYYSHKWKDDGVIDVLDLGCGLGRHTLAFAQDGYNVTACDLSDYAIESARNLLQTHDIDTVRLDVCDMLELPYADDSFDAIFSYHVISHTDTQGIHKILSEITRVLRSKGEIMIDFISVDSIIYRNATTRIDANTIKMEEIAEEYGIPHFFVTIDMIPQLLHDYNIIKMYEKRIINNYTVGARNTFNTHIYVNAKLKE